MATQQAQTPNTEAAILTRIIHPERDDLPEGSAQVLLRFRLDQIDLERMHELAVKNQDDALTPAEKLELESYLRVAYFFDLIHAKARHSLKNHS